jgi:hypothetical protein
MMIYLISEDWHEICSSQSFSRRDELSSGFGADPPLANVRMEERNKTISVYFEVIVRVRTSARLTLAYVGYE